MLLFSFIKFCNTILGSSAPKLVPWKKENVLLTEESLRTFQYEITVTSRGPSMMSYVRGVLYICRKTLFFERTQDLESSGSLLCTTSIRIMIKVKVTQVSLHCYSETSVLRIWTILSVKHRDMNLQQAKTVVLSTLENSPKVILVTSINSLFKDVVKIGVLLHQIIKL